MLVICHTDLAQMIHSIFFYQSVHIFVPDLNIAYGLLNIPDNFVEHLIVTNNKRHHHLRFF